MRESLHGSARAAGMAILATCTLVCGLATLVPANAKPPAQPAVSESDKLKAIKTQGDKAQRTAETRQRLWDRKMKTVSGSICRGC